MSKKEEAEIAEIHEKLKGVFKKGTCVLSLSLDDKDHYEIGVFSVKRDEAEQNEDDEYITQAILCAGYLIMNEPDLLQMLFYKRQRLASVQQQMEAAFGAAEGVKPGSEEPKEGTVLEFKDMPVKGNA